MIESPLANRLPWIVRNGGWLCLLPIPVWLLIRVAIQPEAAWQARYLAEDPVGQSVARYEQTLSHYWTGKKDALEAAPVTSKHLQANFQTCLTLAEAVDVPLMLVAAGKARLLIDERVILEIVEASAHATVGQQTTLAKGVHEIRVEFTGRSRAVIGLLASFDGAPPRPIGSGSLAPGVSTFRPAMNGAPCGR